MKPPKSEKQKVNEFMQEFAPAVEPQPNIKHHCHANGCTVPVPPKLLMCLRHWRMVPREIQTRVWRHYRPGQERDKKPTPEYLAVMAEAIAAVATREAKPPNKDYTTPVA